VVIGSLAEAVETVLPASRDIRADPAGLPGD
jgi:hypothetical protein